MRLDHIISEHIHPILKQAGFARRRNIWNRQRSEFIDVIDFQKSGTAPAGIENFTMNVGIAMPLIHEMIWGKTTGGFFREVDCILRARVGQLIDNDFKGGALDRWWRIQNPEDETETTRELVNITNSVILPFLDRFDSLRSIEEFLAQANTWLSHYDLTKIQMGILKILVGKREEGFDLLLSEKHYQGKDWFEKAQKIGRKLQETV